MDKVQIVKDYFDDFVDAFATFDGSGIATKFTIPYMVREVSGTSKLFHSYSQISEHFQNYLDEYNEKGCTQCQYSNLDIKWLGSESALASVDWTLQNHSGSEVMSWTESYLLSLKGKQATAFASIDHADN